MLVAEADLIPLIALSQPLIVIEFGRKPQILVVKRLQFFCLSGQLRQRHFTGRRRFPGGTAF